MTVDLANPQSWPKKRLRFVARVNKSRVPSSLMPDSEVSFVPMAAVGAYGGINLSETKPIEEIGTGYTPFIENDVVIAKITPCFENGKGAIARGLKNGAAFGTTELHVLSCEAELLPEFAFYLSICTPFRHLGEASMYGAGGQKRVPETFIKDLRFGVPPIATQKEILAFLAERMSEIDDLIAKKQSLLALLAEKRSALITCAVTKGIEENAPMKASGIDWLGDIPAHWESRRFRFLLSAPFKYGANEPAELENPDFPRYIRISDVREDGTLRSNTFRSLPPEVAEPYLLQEGDILLARSGATVGKSFKYEQSWGVAAYAGYLIRARLSDDILADYVKFFLHSLSYWQWIEGSFIQSTIQNVSAEKYANLWMPVPSLKEQAEIVAVISEGITEIDKSRELVQRAIDQLTEYRAAIITKAVTGEHEVM